MLRPPVASDRLAVAADGRVLVTALGKVAEFRRAGRSLSGLGEDEAKQQQKLGSH